MAAAVVLFLVVVVSATAGWVAAEINEPDAPAAPSPSTARTPSTGSAASLGSALKSVTAITVIREALHRLAAGSDLRARLPAGIDAAAVQVTVTNARRPGAVRLDAGAGPVDALRVASSGTTTSNLVVLPVATRTLTVRHGPGGGLTVRVVGTFASSSEERAGRFVSRSPVRVAHLDTAQDGRELTVRPQQFGASPGIRAVLVLVTAEVGAVPARLLVGREPSGIAERMAWGGAVDDNTQRRGLALVPVNAAGEFSLRYEHGTTLDVDVLGWFTGPGAPLHDGALLVPEPATTIFDGRMGRGGADLDVPADARGALLNLAAEPGVAGDLGPTDVAVASGRTLAVVVDADHGTVRLDARRALDTRVDLLGYFVDDR